MLSKKCLFQILFNLLENLKKKKFQNNKQNLIIIIYWKPKRENKYYFGEGTYNEGKQK